MRPRLKSLSLSGFRSFRDDGNSVAFPDTGLVLLQGVNKDTGGSSGSGKTSVNLGIAYALDYCPFPSTTLTNWEAKNTLKVDLTLETDQGEVRIRRSGGQQLWVGGEQVKGGASVVKDRLKSILGVDSDVLALLTYRGQRKPGLFLSRTDAEKKEILTQLLRLDRFEKAIEDGQARLKGLEQKDREVHVFASAASAALECLPSTDVSALELRVSLLEAFFEVGTKDLDVLKQVVSEKENIAKEKAQGAFDSFTAQIQEAEAAVAAIPLPALEFDDQEATRLQTLIAEADRRITSLQTADRKKKLDRDAEVQRLSNQTQVLRRTMAQQPALVKERARLEDELKKLLADICPTCEREWLKSEAKKAQLQGLITEVDEKLADCTAAKALETELTVTFMAIPEHQPDQSIQKFQEARSRAQGQLSNEAERKKSAEQAIRAEYSKKKAEATAAVSELRQLQAEAYQVARQVTEVDLGKARALLEEKNTSVSHSASELKQLRFELDHGKKSEARRRTLEAECKKLNAEFEKTTSELNEERDLLAAIGREGFLGSIFDEVLAEISADTNQILASIANTRHCTIEFRSESTTLKGTVKKSITPILQVAGNEAALEANASGGMFSAIELAVDLALGEVVARREGVAPGWLILDESFSGLDSVSMESCMEILGQYARDRLVLVVDHASEFKSLFSKFISVEYQDGVSTFAT